MKKRLSRIFSSTSAAVLSLSTLLTLGFSGVAHAATFTCTWAGGGGDSNFSTAGNWTGCNGAAPDPLNDTDDLVFPTDTATDFAPVNDLTGATFNSVAFSGTGGSSFNITGNSFTLAGDVTDTSDKANTIATDIVLTSTTTFTVPSGFTMTLSGTVSGAGSVVLAGAGNLTMGTVTITGALTANAGTLTVDYGTGLSVSALTVADGATIWFANPSFSGTSTIAYPVTVGGAGASSGALYFDGDGVTSRTFTLTGTVTLTSNTTFVIAYDTDTVRVEGPFHGPGFTASVLGAGSLVIASSDNTTATPNSAVTTTANFGTPGTPDTGFAYLTANPLLTAGLMTVAAGALVFVARRSRFAHETVQKTAKRK